MDDTLKPVLLRLIQEDFKMIRLQGLLDAAGFHGADYPNISYEIFDLMCIPDSKQAELQDQYWSWAASATGFKEGDRALMAFLNWVYEELQCATGSVLKTSGRLG